MSEMTEKLFMYLELPFVRYALIVGVLIALCSSLLGVTLVLKRFSFIGDGLSHVAFGAMAVAAVTGLTNKMIIVLPVTVLSAILLLRTIAGCFLYRKLIRKFGLEGWWMFFFLLAPNLTTLFFGFNPDIRG